MDEKLRIVMVEPGKPAYVTEILLEKGGKQNENQRKN